jgi:hypothetical protein
LGQEGLLFRLFNVEFHAVIHQIANQAAIQISNRGFNFFAVGRSRNNAAIFDRRFLDAFTFYFVQEIRVGDRRG